MRDRLGRFLRHVIVAFHDVVAVADDFAGHARLRDLLARLRVEKTHVDVRLAVADGVRPLLERVRRIGHRDHGRRFRQTVGVRDVLHVHLLHDLLDQFRRAEGAGHDALMERLYHKRLVFLELRMVQDGDVHRRNAVDRRRVRRRDGIHHDQRVELLDHDGRRAVRQNRHDAEHAAEAVEQRDGQADAFVLVRVELEELPFADVETVVQDAFMRQHDAFREASRARRVLHVHHVRVGGVLLGRRQPFVQIFAAAVAQLDQFGRRVHARMFLLSKIHDVFQPREAFAHEHAARHRQQFGNELVDGVDVADVAQAVDDGQRVHVGLLHKIFQLMLFVVRVDRHENGADLRRREHERQPFGHVSRPDADVASLRHADGHQTLRHQVRTDVEILVRPRQVAVRIHDERMVRAVLHLHGEHVADRLRRETQR